jgi:type II secretory pathway component PulK
VKAGIAYRAQRGVALAVVLWFVAGMSLLVAAVVSAARTDLRLAQVHLHRAQVAAAADGAARLFLADLVDSRLAGAADAVQLSGRYDVGSYRVAINAVPASWLVDPDAAPAELLTMALDLSADLDRAEARALAAAVVQWRDSPSVRRGSRFTAIEDLLNVPGMNRSTLDSVRDYLAEPGTRGLSGLGPRTEERLQLVAALAPGHSARPGESSPRQTDEPAIDEAVQGVLRVDAVVELGERRWLRRSWIRSGTAGAALPWSSLRTEPVRVVGG